MLGIIIQLAITWLLVWFFEKGNLSVLGFRPTKQRLRDFIIFFIVTATFCALGFFVQMHFGRQQWKMNPELTLKLFLSGFWWNLKSVLFEELIFRGALLYILIKKIGAPMAIIISSVAFGIYHWFSFGVIGDPMQMIIAFLTTGTMGLLLAYGYSKTFSLYIPIAIHLGWNLTRIFIFSQGPIGNGVFITKDQEPFRTDSYIVFILVTFVPMLLMFLTDYLLIRRYAPHVNGTKNLIAEKMQ
ncbi:MAG: CPBP family intramembrane glutamic endopeptidase [Ferruginibacter sp.]